MVQDEVITKAILSANRDDRSDPQCIQLHPREYKNKSAIKNTILYITRTRPNETKQNELLSYGTDCGWPCYKSPGEIIEEFMFNVKRFHTTDSLVVHYAIWVPETILNQPGGFQCLNDCMVNYCRYIFWSLGHQCIYAIHYSKRQKLHIHLIVNTTNYLNGKKLKQFPLSLHMQLEYPFHDFYKYYMGIKYSPMPINYPKLCIPSLY